MTDSFYTKITSCTINAICALVLSSAALAAAATAGLAEGRATNLLLSRPAVSAGVSVVQVGAATLLAKQTHSSLAAKVLGGVGFLYAIDGLLTEISLGGDSTTLLTTYIASATIAALGAKLASITFDALKIRNTNQYKIGAGVILGSFAYFGTSLSLDSFPLVSAAFASLLLFR